MNYNKRGFNIDIIFPFYTCKTNKFQSFKLVKTVKLFYKDIVTFFKIFRKHEREHSISSFLPNN